jgi:2-keto-3-deoxy-L-rhamnonate aldolase RhmA
MVVDAIKYAPLGNRWMTPGRANRYGVSSILTTEYLEASNRETLVIVMIEDVEAVKNLPPILRIEGIDVFNIGAGDFANSLGYTGQSTHAKVVEVVEHIMDLAHALGKVISNPAPDAETRKRWFDKGARYITCSTDLRLFRGAAEARLQEIKDSLP